MNAKQFAWYYLINNGTANTEPSYYGGYQVIDKNPPYKSVQNKQWFGYSSYDSGAKEYIKKIGVNWTQTVAPKSRSYSQFTDTFHDPEQKEFLTGTLVLNNGVEIYYCAEPIEVSNVFVMMENMQEAINGAKELFGEI